MISNIISTLTLLILDGIWVGTYMSSQYAKQVMTIQKSPLKANMAYAVLSYMLMVVGLNLFVLPRIRKSHAFTDSLFYGGVFGLVLYGVYDLTAAAVLKDWDIKLALIDMAWGSFVFFISAYIGSFFI